jgi:ABC-type transport system involved in multi-copper enzyme maturation permease subunit
MNAAAGLLFKFWLESRTRFLISAAGIATVCLGGMLFRDTLGAPIESRLHTSGDPYVAYMYKLVYSGTAKGLFLICALILGVGGLHREASQRTHGFTLALPVTRRQLVGYRAVVGFTEIALLSLVPAAVILFFSPMLDQFYPPAQLFRFSLLWFVGGLVTFGLSFLASVILMNGYSALVAAFTVQFCYETAMIIPVLRQFPLKVFYITSGWYFIDHRTSMLVRPLPWYIFGVMAAVAFVLVGTAAEITRKRDCS